MSEEDRSASKPADKITMDQYGEAAKAFIRARTAATCAAFFLGYLKPGMALLDCGCGEGTITVDLAAAVVPGQVVGLDIAPGTLQHARRVCTLPPRPPCSATPHAAQTSRVLPKTLPCLD